MINVCGNWVELHNILYYIALHFELLYVLKICGFLVKSNKRVINFRGEKMNRSRTYLLELEMFLAIHLWVKMRTLYSTSLDCNIWDNSCFLLKHYETLYWNWSIMLQWFLITIITLAITYTLYGGEMKVISNTISAENPVRKVLSSWAWLTIFYFWVFKYCFILQMNSHILLKIPRVFFQDTNKRKQRDTDE